MALSKTLLQALAVTVELTGTDLSRDAARVMAQDLSRYPEEQVLGALVRCRREIRSRLTVADVIARLDDGRPGPEEAWAMVPADESQTLVWTDEVAAAYGVALPLINQGDTVAARMAFLEAYRKRVMDARDRAIPVHWTPSLGTDATGREAALTEAVRLGRLPSGQVAGFLSHLEAAAPAVAALIEEKPCQQD